MKRITAVNPDGSTNKSFNGAVGPVHFQNGVVEVDGHDAYVAYCALNVQFKVEDLDEVAEAGPVDPSKLKGKALDAALEAAGLAKSGNAEEKRARLVEHLAAQESDGEADDEPDDDDEDDQQGEDDEPGDEQGDESDD